ncbi:MAG: protein-L-isoaspartate(D-aspartate) O-methyltransferase [Luminiphilus sp.]|nr:protein-L-isoaspartate(D-aspartate) O-methyltransferase [Luminiphilus sp.]
MTSQRTRERLIQRLMDQGITRFEVLEAIRSVPRHLFVDEALAHRSYEDTALPIGYGQTLSQPYVVAKMSELALAQGRPRKVLELGSGSGYQTAILASLVGEIYAIERIKPLVERARKQLRALRVRNVRLRHGDGLEGWASEAPFDLILGAAAPERLPTQLLEQLAPEGRLILPVGGERQQLIMVTAIADGYVEEVIEEVNFVPMVRGVSR